MPSATPRLIVITIGHFPVAIVRLMSTTTGGGRRNGDQSTTINPIQLIILYGCQRLFLFKLIYVMLVIYLVVI
jgi:hypothetical protein